MASGLRLPLQNALWTRFHMAVAVGMFLEMEGLLNNPAWQ